ncbi:MAG: hypothetical protein ABFD79_12540 [Phycisphaerales bacterium]
MDDKLKAWLDSLSAADQKKAKAALGDLVGEVETDPMLKAARRAAGLSERKPEESNDVDKMRRSAGLE